MQVKAELAFSGSSLNRAAQLRSDHLEIAKLLAKGRVLAVWRGKVLAHEDCSLGWIEAENAALHGGKAPIFLGFASNIAYFAQDISHWAPEASDPDHGAAGFLDQTAQRHPALPESLSFQDLRGLMTTLSPQDAELAATAKALTQWHASHGYCATCGAESEVSQSGWQRNCATCGAQHFPRTDPVVIMLIERENRVLIGRNTQWPEGMYSLLAGFIEPGETVEAAVRREVQEETGVKVGAVRYITSQPWPFPASLMLGCHGQAETEAIVIDPLELEDARWVSREEMVTVMAGQHPHLKGSRKGSIAHYLLSEWLADRRK